MQHYIILQLKFRHLLHLLLYILHYILHTQLVIEFDIVYVLMASSFEKICMLFIFVKDRFFHYKLHFGKIKV